MRLSALARWWCFALYAAGFFTLPLAILWGIPGAFIGGTLALTFLVLLRYQGTARIAQKISVKAVSKAEEPQLFAVTAEYCRRLDIPLPKLGKIASPAVNLGVFGFSPRDAMLVVTQGALDRLSREQLAALVGRQLTTLWYPETFLASWLSRFFAATDRLVNERRIRRATQTSGRRLYPFRLFVRQVTLYPLTLPAVFFLRARIRSPELDARAARLTRQPRALAEGLRLIDAFSQRLPLHAPFSTRHLFLLAPPSQDPLARVFFGSEDLHPRIEAVEGLSKVTALA